MKRGNRTADLKGKRETACRGNDRQYDPALVRDGKLIDRVPPG